MLILVFRNSKHVLRWLIQWLQCNVSLLYVFLSVTKSKVFSKCIHNVYYYYCWVLDFPREKWSKIIDFLFQNTHMIFLSASCFFFVKLVQNHPGERMGQLFNLHYKLSLFLNRDIWTKGVFLGGGGRGPTTIVENYKEESTATIFHPTHFITHSADQKYVTHPLFYVWWSEVVLWLELKMRGGLKSAGFVQVGVRVMYCTRVPLGMGLFQLTKRMPFSMFQW